MVDLDLGEHESQTRPERGNLAPSNMLSRNVKSVYLGEVFFRSGNK